jgi:hypothetical protein
MSLPPVLQCDGCGQPATPEHVTRRLQRLEWMTRYRPVHVGTILLGAISPERDTDFLYSTAGSAFAGEGLRALQAVGLSAEGKSKDAVLSDFQRRGMLLGFVLECPLNAGLSDPVEIQNLLQTRLGLLLARIRRSYRPKRLIPVSTLLSPLLQVLTEKELACTVLLDSGKPFDLEASDADNVATRLRAALAAT